MKNLNIVYNEDEKVNFFTHSIDIISKESLSYFQKGFLFQGFALPPEKITSPDQFSRWSQVISIDDLDFCRDDLNSFIEIYSNISAMKLLATLKLETLKIKEIDKKDFVFLKDRGLVIDINEVISITNQGIMTLSLIALWGNIFRNGKRKN